MHYEWPLWRNLTCLSTLTKRDSNNRKSLAYHFADIVSIFSFTDGKTGLTSPGTDLQWFGRGEWGRKGPPSLFYAQVGLWTQKSNGNVLEIEWVEIEGSCSWRSSKGMWLNR